MTLAKRLNQLLQRVAKWPEQDLEATVRGHWDRRAPGHKTVFHLKEFEDDMWRRDLKMARTPFEHHLAMMQLFKKEVAPRLEPSSSARRPGSLTWPASLR
jgi:hypothetical protein